MQFIPITTQQGAQQPAQVHLIPVSGQHQGQQFIVFQQPAISAPSIPIHTTTGPQQQSQLYIVQQPAAGTNGQPQQVCFSFLFVFDVPF